MVEDKTKEYNEEVEKILQELLEEEGVPKIEWARIMRKIRILDDFSDEIVNDIVIVGTQNPNADLEFQTVLERHVHNLYCLLKDLEEVE